MTEKKNSPDAETIKRGKHVLRARAEIARSLDGKGAYMFTAKLREPSVARSRINRVLGDEGLDAIDVPEDVRRAVDLMLDAIEDAIVHGDGADALAAAETLDHRRLRGFVEECRRQMTQSADDAILGLPSYFSRYFPEAAGLTRDDAQWAVNSADKDILLIAAGLLVRGGVENKRAGETLNAAVRRVFKDRIKKLASKSERLRIEAAYQKK